MLVARPVLGLTCIEGWKEINLHSEAVGAYFLMIMGRDHSSVEIK